MGSVLVVTSEGDIHAAAFQERFRQRCPQRCRVFEVDTTSSKDAISWSLPPGAGVPPRVVLHDRDGEPFDLSEVGAIWWRRFNSDPKIPGDPIPLAQYDLIRNDCRAAVQGALLTAFVAGAEVMIRIGRATKHSNETRGFHAPGTTGPFGAAVACGHLMGFDAERMTNALGIAGSLSSGLVEFARSGTGAMVKRLHFGRAAEGGVLAVNSGIGA